MPGKHAPPDYVQKITELQEETLIIISELKQTNLATISVLDILEKQHENSINREINLLKQAKGLQKRLESNTSRIGINLPTLLFIAILAGLIGGILAVLLT